MTARTMMDDTVDIFIPTAAIAARDLTHSTVAGATSVPVAFVQGDEVLSPENPMGRKVQKSAEFVFDWDQDPNLDVAQVLKITTVGSRFINHEYLITNLRRYPGHSIQVRGDYMTTPVGGT